MRRRAGAHIHVVSSVTSISSLGCTTASDPDPTLSLCSDPFPDPSGFARNIKNCLSLLSQP